MTTSSPTLKPTVRSEAIEPVTISTPSAGQPAGRRIAAALAANRHEAAAKFMQSVGDWEKYREDIAGSGADLPGFLERNFVVFVDYLELFFRTGDVTYKNLYIGEKIKQAYFETEVSLDQQIERRKIVADADARGLRSLLQDKVGEAELSSLESELNAIAAVLTTRAKHTLEVLLVGDCLFLDVMAFLPGASLEDQVSINPTFLTSKNPIELRDTIRQNAKRKFDLIFYSPFTYEFSPELARVMDWRFATANGAKIKSLANSAWENALGTLDLMSDLFECNIFVHNASNVRRHDSSVGERFKNVLTRRSRRAARDIVNAKLTDYVAKRNAATFDHLFVVDELPLVQAHGDVELGRMFYDSDVQHPAAMGKWVAKEHSDVLAVHAHLLKKKLVVCDLDNTLWKGVIGEGAVEHYADRQHILKRLQAKGVVLAINSKNDPKNVHWAGGVLNENDFVCSQINWENKVSNLKRIAQILNLKTKDFVFIDDRADEREMVTTMLPEIQVLDATSDRAWKMMDVWASTLSSQGETDRTQFYKQKEARESFLQQTGDEDQGKMFEKLGITVDVRDAKKSDLKRVAELINRTNQFNTCGSRTTLREVTDWQAAGDRRILVIDAGDKFGTMGTVAIAIVHLKPDQVEIPIFVLSCRVFGYGIENVVVNAVKRMAREKGVPVVGPMKETPHNEPCRKVYSGNGFEWDGSVWIYKGTGTVQDPSWLKITFADPKLAA